MKIVFRVKQGNLFDAEAGKKAKEEAIDRAEQGASLEFLAAAQQAVISLARGGGRFTTDDVWSLIVRSGVNTVREPRAIGAVMRKAKDEGWAEPLEEWQLSDRAVCHRRPLRVWRGRL